MLTTAVTSNNDLCDVSQSLLQRLRISGSKNRQLKQRPLALPPFRRRTESVNTVMSFNSLSDTVPDNNFQSREEIAENGLISTHKGFSSPLEWLEKECPSDILPKVLAFCGPQQVAALSKTNKHWNAIVHQEKTWRVMCEELYKWKPSDPEPDSWFDLYRYSPCVPVDYSSIHKALSIALEPVPMRARRISATKQLKQIRSIRILLRPGIYWLKQAIEIQAIPGVTIYFGTVDLPRNVYRPVRHITEIMEQPLPLPLPESETNSGSRKRGPSFRNLFNCKRQVPSEETDVEDTDFTDDWRDNGNFMPTTEPKHATLILRSRRNNEPVVRVRQGVVCMRNIEIQHNSLGLDIWNGNAAVQIQPPLGEDDQPMNVEPRPTAFLECVHISSQTGRGIVNIDGGKVILRNSAVADCAATGVYIGGPGSHAIIENSDVIRNGVGNRIRRGIARGHSGIYLEQGIAGIRNSNVSSNTLTGISVVSPENAFLTLQGSTLMNNGTYQLELPPPGSLSRQRCVNENNVMAVRGVANLRSGLTLTEPPNMLQQQQPTTFQQPVHFHIEAAQFDPNM